VPKPSYQRDGITLYLGDCLDILPTLGTEPFGAVASDPPYGLRFMGATWDHGVPGEAFWRVIGDACLPGAVLAAFGGTRTWHRLACGVEDAGWELRDTLCWLYGQGFPKSHDISKAIDKAEGAEREVVAPRVYADGTTGSWRASTSDKYAQDSWSQDTTDRPKLVTAPATAAATEWSGWGTALKPAWEPVVMARKRFAGTVAGNVLAHGTGGLNIDGCRISNPTGESAGGGWGWPGTKGDDTCYNQKGWQAGFRSEQHRTGRWPANVVLSHHAECKLVGTRRVKGHAGHNTNVKVGLRSDTKVFGQGDGQFGVRGHTDADGLETVEAWECHPDCPVRRLDEQSGVLAGRGNAGPTSRQGGQYNAFGDYAGCTTDAPHWHDRQGGGASRFFYCAKASRRERGDGNDHPTVKPLALMQWLIRLVTPPKAVVLDPFCGSGTTLLAARAEGRRAVGIDSDPHAIEIAVKRLEGEALPLFEQTTSPVREED